MSVSDVFSICILTNSLNSMPMNGTISHPAESLVTALMDQRLEQCFSLLRKMPCIVFKQLPAIVTFTPCKRLGTG